MDLVTDFLLLAASATACLYCIVLNRRLKNLTNAKEGLGAGIAALSQSAEEMKTAISATRSTADSAATRVEALLKDANEKAEEIRRLIDELSETGAAVVSEAEGATKKYVDTLAPFLGEANEAAARLLSAIERAPADVVREDAPVEVVEDATLEEEIDDSVVTLDDAQAIAIKRLRARAGAAA